MTKQGRIIGAFSALLVFAAVALPAMADEAADKEKGAEATKAAPKPKFPPYAGGAQGRKASTV